jgi:hypothetical protein
MRPARDRQSRGRGDVKMTTDQIMALTRAR